MSDNESQTQDPQESTNQLEPNTQIQSAISLLKEFQKELESQNAKKSKKFSPDGHLPDAIKGNGAKMSEILDQFKNENFKNGKIFLENFSNLIKQMENDGINQDLKIQTAGEMLKNLISIQPEKLKNSILQKIKQQTIIYLSKLYRFNSFTCKLHLEDEKDAGSFIASQVLAEKFQNYRGEGYLDLLESQPVIYISQAGPASIASQICKNLGLPISCIAVVPTANSQSINGNENVSPGYAKIGGKEDIKDDKIDNENNNNENLPEKIENLTNNNSSDNTNMSEKVSEAKHEMSFSILDRMIAEDLATGKRPCLVLANAGSPALGHDDPIHLLKVLCDKYNLWLHVRGPNLSTKCLSSSNLPLLACTKADSVTLNIGDWFSISSLPSLTLIRANRIILEENVNEDKEQDDDKKTQDNAELAIENDQTKDQKSTQQDENEALQLQSDKISESPQVVQNTIHIESTFQENLCYIPIWLSILSLGYNGISSKATLAQDMVSKFVTRLSKNSNLDISVKNKLKKVSKSTHKSFKSLIDSTSESFADYSMVHPILVCFRLAPCGDSRKVEEKEIGGIEKENLDEDGIDDVKEPKIENQKPEKTRSKSPEKKKNEKKRSKEKKAKKKKKDEENKETTEPIVEKSNETPETNQEIPLEQEINEQNQTQPEENILDEFLQDLYDSLNIRLYEHVQNNIPEIVLDAVSLQDRIFLRFTPIVSAYKAGTSLENLDKCIDSIEKEIDVNTKLIQQIQAIRASVSQSDNLDYYCDPDSFSLGLLQVVPTFLQHLDINNLGASESEDFEWINKNVFTKISTCPDLKLICTTSQDLAGNSKIAIHIDSIISETSTINKMVTLISEYGHICEKDLLNLKIYTKNLLEAKGKAEEQLILTKEKVLLEESSIVEHIPVVNSLVGFIFGGKDEEKINRKMVGRTFDVTTGRMSSTKKTYEIKGQNYEFSDETENSENVEPISEIEEKEEDNENVEEEESNSSSESEG